MDEKLIHQIDTSKVDVNEISEVLESFDIDQYLHEKIRNLDERLRTLEIKFQALCNSRR